jgi:Tol biopolymer transport system component
MLMVDRHGREEKLAVPSRAYAYPRISPDGSSIAVDSVDEQQDVWLWNFARRVLTRISFDPAPDAWPVWMPNGKEIIYASGRTGAPNVFQQLSDGTGDAKRLTHSEHPQVPLAVTPDGRGVLVREDATSSGRDFIVLHLDTGKADRLLSLGFGENNADLSPDGRWIAYQSDESGRSEIFVRPFTDPNGGRWQVSSDGGSKPVWNRNGRELFFLDRTARIASVVVERGQTFSWLPQQRILEKPYFNNLPGRTFDPTPDGQRFIVTTVDGTIPTSTLIEVVVNGIGQHDRQSEPN